MLNAFELEYGLDPLDPADALLNPDNDLRNNLEEYLDGTHPGVSNEVNVPLAFWVPAALLFVFGLMRNKSVGSGRFNFR